MKKIFVILLSIILTSCCAYAAKYKVNTNGTVKNNGKIVSPSNKNKSPYNVYNPSTYINSNVVNSAQVQVIELVMDYSGSMSNWINVAKNAMTSILAQIPSSTKVGFRVFGHNNNGYNPNTPATVASVKKIIKQKGKYKAITGSNFLGTTSGYCSATKQVSPIVAKNKTLILSGMNSVNLGGSTPLVYGLERVINQDFAGMSTNFAKKIVLISDGGENCGGDPCEFAKDLMRRRSDVHIDVVLVGSSSKKLSCLSSSTGGHFYNVKNLSEFSTVMTQSMTSTPSTVKQEKQQYEFYNN